MKIQIKAVYGGFDTVKPAAGKTWQEFDVLKLYDIEKGEAVRLPMLAGVTADLTPGATYQLELDVVGSMRGYVLDLRVHAVHGKVIGG